MVNEQKTGTALLMTLLAVDLFIIAINLGYAALGQGAPVHINVDKEANIPTWWSSIKLAALATPFLLSSLWFRREGQSWKAMAFLFLFFLAMSVDETSRLHEDVGFELDGRTRQDTVFHRTGLWFIVVGVPAIVFFALLVRQVAPVLARVPGTLPLLTLGFAVLAGGALAVEALGNLLLSPEALASGERSTPVLIGNVAEEGFEMIGASLMVMAAWRFVLDYPGMPFRMTLSSLLRDQSHAFNGKQ